MLGELLLDELSATSSSSSVRCPSRRRLSGTQEPGVGNLSRWFQILPADRSHALRFVFCSGDRRTGERPQPQPRPLPERDPSCTAGLTLPHGRLATTPIAGVKAGRRPPVGLGLDAGEQLSPTIATGPPERSGGGPICRPDARNPPPNVSGPARPFRASLPPSSWVAPQALPQTPPSVNHPIFIGATTRGAVVAVLLGAHPRRIRLSPTPRDHRITSARGTPVQWGVRTVPALTGVHRMISPGGSAGHRPASLGAPDCLISCAVSVADTHTPGENLLPVSPLLDGRNPRHCTTFGHFPLC